MKNSTITIKKVYSWYDVYVDNRMILHHISEHDKNDILTTAKISGEKIIVN